MATACTHASPTFSSSVNFLSRAGGEKLGEVCILDNFNMILEALSVDEFW